MRFGLKLEPRFQLKQNGEVSIPALRTQLCQWNFALLTANVSVETIQDAGTRPNKIEVFTHGFNGHNDLLRGVHLSIESGKDLHYEVFGCLHSSLEILKEVLKVSPLSIEYEINQPVSQLWRQFLVEMIIAELEARGVVDELL